MKVSFLAVAVILCSLGFSYGDIPSLQPCEPFPGYLYILKTHIKAEDNEEDESWTYELHGASGALPQTEKIEYHASSVGDVTILEQDRIEVYDCVASINAAYHFLQKFQGIDC